MSMTSGRLTARLMAGSLVLSGVLAGAGIYYTQVYAFYDEVAAQGPSDVTLVPQDGGAPVPVAHDGFEAIDSDSSPIRFRACFQTETPLDALSADFTPYENAIPRNAPHWFSCFDAAAIGAALEAGTARAFLGQKNIGYGVDQVVVVTEAGQGYIWHELNDCGEKAYDGTVVGEECPPRDAFD
jgi:hypothetical protein